MSLAADDQLRGPEVQGTSADGPTGAGACCAAGAEGAGAGVVDDGVGDPAHRSSPGYGSEGTAEAAAHGRQDLATDPIEDPGSGCGGIDRTGICAGQED